ncbi:ZZ-type domain-containing protein, partial [Durusdinium trenchii]
MATALLAWLGMGLRFPVLLDSPSHGLVTPWSKADDEGDLCTLVEIKDAVLWSSSREGGYAKKSSRVGQDGKTLSDAELPSKSDTPPQGPPPGLEKEDQDRDFSSGPGAWGPGGNGGGPRRLLSTLRMLREAGMLTPAMFASLTVQWLPLLTQRVARKVDKINHMARDGLDATLQKMLEIVQDQAAGTPGLEHYAALIAEALGGRGGQRRLGEAILEMLKALRGLGFEVQTHFCESIASSLLPYLE